MHLSFAHMSDPHNPLTPNVTVRQLLNKRLLGYLSWHRKRHLRHRPEILTSMLDDVNANAPDHIVVSGDLVNIALPDEFTASKVWLEQVGAPRDVTVIPGNHDAYVSVPFDQGIGQWAPWMLGDNATDVSFPFVRQRGPVVFIMLSTSNPTPPLSASGTLGKEQLHRLEAVLNHWRGKDVFRVVVLHHPPEDYPTKRRKALRDRAAFRKILARTGAELVLHGHQHHSHFGLIGGPQGKIPVLGVSSASMVLNPKKGDEARWNLIDVRREGMDWRLSNHARGLTEQGFDTIGRWSLQIPAS
ncbi:metallophosphoesterase [Octadecabacter sp.]|nr:metallophosphoesterase [Octadecabacter sp.]